MRPRSAVVAVVLLATTVGDAAAQEPEARDAALGQWITEGGLSRVEVYGCGDALCGRIVWLEEPLETDGTPKVDDENEDEALRARPLMGLEIIAGFEPDGRPGRWRNGTIYNPEDGKTYRCMMRLADDGTLIVRGYVLLPILGRSQTWTRHRD
ncbi:MAG: DUF2147 domain-containing protein [Proteobacteria bacterium]|nr:DUF2147 domain-containing protein [Pseudomonadota bacterium]MDA1131619.1 DUF2147 domain-containing protein [Pseudomonadota bacterium]